MIDCLLKLNADGFYECPDCKWIYKRKADKPPHRNCPKSPDINSPEHRERIKAKMLAELQPVIDNRNCPQCDLANVTAQLDRCLSPCLQFNGYVCTRMGSNCKYWQRWKEALACMVPCRAFEPSPG
jgi:rubredoxin